MLQQLIDQVEGVTVAAKVNETISLVDSPSPAPVLCAEAIPEPKVPPSATESPPIEEDISDWWDDSDLKIKLKISTSTIQRRRKDGTFKFFCIGRRYYYLRQDILLIRHRFMK